MERRTVSPTPTMLKALTHPVRLRMLGILRSEGPATASQLATRLELNTGATSYHLRQLAQHGFIEDDPERGNGRDRWWRAAHLATVVETDPGDADSFETVDAYMQSVVTIYAERLQRAVEERPALPIAWREAETFSDWSFRISPARAIALREALVEVLVDTQDETSDDALDVAFMLNVFPRPGQVGGTPG